MSARTPGSLTALLLVACADAPSWSEALPDEPLLDESPPVHHDAGPPMTPPLTLVGSEWPCPIQLVTDERHIFRPEWQPCPSMEGCTRLDPGESSSVIVDHDGDRGRLVHVREWHNQIFYTLMDLDGEGGFTLGVPCERTHCQLVGWRMGEGHVAFVGLEEHAVTGGYWSSSDRLDVLPFRLPSASAYPLVVGADELRFQDGRDEIVVLDRDGNVRSELGRGVYAGGRWLWAEEGRVLESFGDGGDTFYDHGGGIIRDLVSDGADLAWTYRADWSAPCEVWVAPAAIGGSPPRTLSGSCGSLSIGGRRVAVTSESGVTVHDLDTGAVREIELPIGRTSGVRSIVRDELLVTSDGFLYRIRLD